MVNKLKKDSDVFILKALLEAMPAFVSGSALAKQLGVSRVSVCERLKHFRDQGFHIEAKSHRGYRLIEEPSCLQSSLIKAHLLKDDKLTIPLFYFDCLDSTNSEAQRQLARGQKTPFVVIAGKQTSGRGRMGRRWHSAREGNVYLSFAFQPPLSPQQMQTFTLWVGIKVCAFLRAETGLPLQVKWPNDLMLNEKKVGGILTEAHVDMEQVRDLTLGLGVNVNGDRSDWPEELRDKAISLSETSGKPFALNAFLARLIEVCLAAYNAFIENSGCEALFSHWPEYDLMKGKRVQARSGKETFVGVAEGIDKNGSLLLRCERKGLVALNSGEVSVYPQFSKSCVTNGD